MTTAIDIQEILSAYNAEIGTWTQRALLAEASNKAQERDLTALHGENEQLRQQNEELLLQVAQAQEDEVAPDPKGPPHKS